MARASVTAVAAAALAAACTAAAPTALFVSTPGNDAWALLAAAAAANASALPFNLARYDTVESALGAAQRGDVLLVTADGANATTGTWVTPAAYAAAAAAGVRALYAEMPAWLPGASGDPAPPPLTPVPVGEYARLVVVGGALAPQLAADELLQANAAYTLPLAGNSSAFTAPPLLVLAVVAGCGSAVYGLPQPNETVAALTALPLQPGAGAGAAASALVASLPLSGFVTGRYAPAGRWRALWGALLTRLFNASVDFPAWTPAVHPAAATPAEGLARAALAAQAAAGNATARAALTALEAGATRAASDWLAVGSGLLVAGDGANATCQAPWWPAAAAAGLAVDAPPPPPLACLLEGFSSPVAPNGSQAVATDLRADCNAEGAMTLAVRAWLDRRIQPPPPAPPGPTRLQRQRAPPPFGTATGVDFAAAAGALLNYTLLFSSAQQGPRNAAGSPQDGIIAWSAAPDPTDTGSSFGDDNARVLLASAVTMAVLSRPPWGADTAAWARGAVKSLLANYRTCSADGYRWGRMNMPDFGAHGGWAYFALSGWNYTTCPIWPQPHYQAALWGAYLWGFAATGWAPLYVKAEAGVASAMEAYATAGGYAARWETTEYLSEERARLLTTAAWLVRADALVDAAVAAQRKAAGTAGVNASTVHLRRGVSRADRCALLGACPAGSPADHREWLHTLGADYTARQTAFGGVQEQLGNQTNADFPAPTSNAAYGTDEAPVAQNSTDAVTDALYSNNFGLLGLWEAFAATGDAAAFGAPADALAAYLTSTQAVSDDHPTLAGGWPRAFHYGEWDYFGSAADHGWGPWSFETGWTTSWIATVLALRAASFGGSIGGSAGSVIGVWDLIAAPGATGVDAPALLAAWCPLFLPPGWCAEGTFVDVRAASAAVAAAAAAGKAG